MTARMTAAQFAATAQAPGRRSKYRNRKTVVDGKTFDSKAEAKRYADLKNEERAGLISDLILQPHYPIEVNGKTVCTYVGDFAYHRDGVLVTEDVKGVRTPVYRLKAKLFEAVYGYKITEVSA